MTRQETLEIIDSLNKKLDSMTDEELYEHMMATSPSFRKTVESLDDYLESLDDYPGPRGHEKITEIKGD